MTSGFNTIDWHTEEGIGYLQLNQPPGNPMTLAFFQELLCWEQEVYPRETCRALIIYGAGRHFSSGADIDELLDQATRLNPSSRDACTPEAESFFTSNQTTISFFGSLDIPVIAAIRGVCLGSALELALSCDFRICTGEAVLGLPETTFNLMPGLGGIEGFTRLAGKAKGLEYVLTGQTFNGNMAQEMGLTDLIVSRKEVMSTAKALAHWLPGSFQKGFQKIYLKRFQGVEESL